MINGYNISYRENEISIRDIVLKYMREGVRVMRKKIIAFLLCILFVYVVAADGVSVTAAQMFYESDQEFHEEGYIFIGESHIGLAMSYFGAVTDETGSVPNVNDVKFFYTDKGSDRHVMKGNLFFVCEGTDKSTQSAKEYIYSDGKGNRGKAVERVHAVMDANPNIAHWNIILYQGAAQAKQGSQSIADYYAASYRNWIDYEFPEADIYFLSISTMTKYFRACRNPELLNDALRGAFSDMFLDYTEFYNERYPQGMWDPTQKSDTIHWNWNTYEELVTGVIRQIQDRRGEADTADVAVTETEAVLYTNSSTVIYSSPDMNGKVLFWGLETGLPIHVTGVTDNGFFRIDLGEMTAYIHGEGLSVPR